MKKIFVSLCSSLLLIFNVQAQSVSPLQAGLKQLYYSQYSAAQKTLSIYYKGTPGQNYFWYIQSLLQDPFLEDKLDKVKVLNQNALRASLPNPYLYLVAGELDILENKPFSTAKEKFAEASAESAKDSNFVFALATSLSIGKEKDDLANEAIDGIQKALSQEKNKGKWQLLLGKNCLKLGKTDDAMQAFKSATSDPLVAAAAWTELGKLYQYKLGNPSAMLSAYQNAIQSDSNFAPAYLQLFFAQQESNPAAAESSLLSFVSKSDTSARQQSLPIVYYRQTQQWGKLINYAMVANHNSYLTLSDYLEMGNYVKQSGEKIKAIDWYSKGYEKSNYAAEKIEFVDSIVSCFDSTQSEQQLRWLETGVHDSATVEGLYRLAITAVSAGGTSHFALADSAFQQLLNLDPTSENGYVAWYKCRMLWKNPAKTVKSPLVQYISFLEKDPKENKRNLIKYNKLLGIYYGKQEHDFPKAIQCFEYVLRLDPADADAKKMVTLLKSNSSK